VRACGADDEAATSMNGRTSTDLDVDGGRRLATAGSPPVWSTARPPSTPRQEVYGGQVVDGRAELTDSERSTTSSGVDDSRSPTCDDDDVASSSFAALNNNIRLASSISSSPIQSTAVC